MPRIAAHRPTATRAGLYLQYTAALFLWCGMLVALSIAMLNATR